MQLFRDLGDARLFNRPFFVREFPGDRGVTTLDRNSFQFLDDLRGGPDSTFIIANRLVAPGNKLAEGDLVEPESLPKFFYRIAHFSLD